MKTNWNGDFFEKLTTALASGDLADVRVITACNRERLGHNVVQYYWNTISAFELVGAHHVTRTGWSTIILDWPGALRGIIVSAVRLKAPTARHSAPTCPGPGKIIGKSPNSVSRIFFQ